MIGAVVPNEGSMVTTSIHQLAGSATGYIARARAVAFLKAVLLSAVIPVAPVVERHRVA